MTIAYDQTRTHLSLQDVRAAHEEACILAEAIQTEDPWNVQDWFHRAEGLVEILDNILVRHGIVEKRQYGCIEARIELEI